MFDPKLMPSHHVVPYLKKVWELLAKNKEPMEAVVALGAISGTVWQGGRLAVRRLKLLRDRTLLDSRVGGNYTTDDLLLAKSNYIEPDCQSTDPLFSSKEESEREPAIAWFYKHLAGPNAQRFTLLLADAGMGKTSFLMNLYAFYLLKHRDAPISLISLTGGEADKQIQEITNLSNTIVLLDSLDEDPNAIGNPVARLLSLTHLLSNAKHVVISCRGQFFAAEAEVPRGVGVMIVRNVPAGSSKEYHFQEVFLSPFSDEQVRRYLRSALPWWKVKSRRTAFDIARKVPDLTARPMLLAHIPDMLAHQGPIKSSADVYEAMIDAWLERERTFFDPQKLRKFAENMALDIWLNRDRRKSEGVPAREIEQVFLKNGLAIADLRQLRARSLLSRDRMGTLRFSHRSILEYLFVIVFLKDSRSLAKVDWSDQMKRFWWEILSAAWPQNIDLLSSIKYADVNQLENLNLAGLLTLRAEPMNIPKRSGLCRGDTFITEEVNRLRLNEDAYALVKSLRAIDVCIYGHHDRSTNEFVDQSLDHFLDLRIGLYWLIQDWPDIQEPLRGLKLRAPTIAEAMFLPDFAFRSDRGPNKAYAVSDHTERGTIIMRLSRDVKFDTVMASGSLKVFVAPLQDAIAYLKNIYRVVARDSSC